MNNKNTKTSINKNDIILTVIILAICVCFFAAYMIFNHKSGSYVQIHVDGKLYKELPLNKDTTITIEGTGGTNTLNIHNGYADMTDADCPDKLCVRQKKTHNSGETLVCLPHKVVVTVVSDKKGNLDGVAS